LQDVRDGQLAAWLVTLVSEGIVAALLARSFGLVPWKAAAAAVLGSLVSHPIVWWGHFQIVGAIGYWPTFAVVEAFAVLVETPFYRVAGAKWGDALALSFVVNAASVLCGFALQAAKLI
jgi:hypothetical protein